MHLGDLFLIYQPIQNYALTKPQLKSRSDGHIIDLLYARVITSIENYLIYVSVHKWCCVVSEAPLHWPMSLFCLLSA